MMQPQRIQQLAAEAQRWAAAAPTRSEGTDRTGTVHITLGPDGMPQEIRVTNGWQDRLAAGGQHLLAAGTQERLAAGALANAVSEANANAREQGLRAWNSALPHTTGHATPSADLGPSAAHAAPLTDIGPSAAHDVSPSTDISDFSGGAEASAGRVRDENELAEEVIGALKRAGAPLSVVDGRDGGGHVTVRLGVGGLEGCEVAADWARERDGGEISAAFAAALRDALGKRAAAEGALGGRAAAGGGVDSLVGDAVAALKALGERGGR